MKNKILFGFAFMLLFTMSMAQADLMLYQFPTYNESDTTTTLSNNLYVSGNITSSFLFGNGSQLTGITLTETDPLWTANSTAVLNWNETYANTLYAPIGYGDDWNKTYADTLYYSISNPLNFINQTQADLIYYSLSNPFGYYNSTTLPSDAVTSVFGRTGVITAQANDYTWLQINKTTSSIADITSRTISLLSDVDTTGVADTNVLTYNSTSGNWEAKASASGTSYWNRTGTTLEPATSGDGMIVDGIAVFGGATNKATFDADGKLTLSGTARVYKSIWNYAYNMYGYAGTRNGTACGVSALAGLQTQWLFQSFDDGQGAGICESAVMTFPMPDDYVDGSDFNVSVHWTASSTTGNVVFGIGVWGVNMTEQYSVPDYEYIEGTVSAPSSTYKQEMVEVTFDGTDFDKQTDIGVVFYRLADDDGDTMSEDALVSSIEVKYLSDGIGKRQ